MNCRDYLKQLFQIILWLAVVISPLSACSGTLRVEPDAHDPNLHGQVVRFTVPVVYMELKEEDKEKFDQKSLDIGKILITADEESNLFNSKGTHVIQKINKDMEFTIIESYYVRHDWFTREFAADYQQIILKDNNGILSTTNRLILQDSNKIELAK